MKYTWLVEKYLEGELSGEALRKFELEILRKPEVAEEVERIRNLQKFMQHQHSRLIDSSGLIEDYEDLDNVIPVHEIAAELEGLRVRKVSNGQRHLRTKLSETEMNRDLITHHSNKILVKKLSVWIAAASIILLFLTSSLLLIGGKQSVDYMKVYTEFYSASPLDPVQRNAIQTEESVYGAALGLYGESRYPEAFDLFNQIPEKSAPNSAYYLYKGIAAMETGRFPEAIGLFDQLDRDPVRNHDAMWYKGLSYLAMDDPDNARLVLQSIVDQSGYHAKACKTILRKIR